MALEIGFGLDRPVLRADHQEAGFLERLGNVHERNALLARHQRTAHPGHDHVGTAARNHLLGRNIRATGLDIDVNAFLGIEALVLGHVIAGKLRLRDPLELQRHRITGEAGRRTERHGTRHEAHQKLVHSHVPLSFCYVRPPRTDGCQKVMARSTMATTQ